MRRFILPVLLASVTLSANAATRVIVSEMLQTVTADVAVLEPDTEIERQINEMELTERLSEVTIDQLSSRVTMPQKSISYFSQT